MKIRENFPITAILLLILGLAVAYSLNPPETRNPEMDFSDFYQSALNKQVSSVKINGESVEGVNIKGKSFRTTIPRDSGFNLAKELQQNGVRVKIENYTGESLWQILSSAWLPFLLLIGFWFVMMRQMKGGGALSFGKSRHRLISSLPTVTFRDVAGVEEAKEELSEIIEFLRQPQKFRKLGGRIPKGVLLMGPPGTGKTLLARAVAGEANVPFFSISGSEFVEMFVGVGASRVRDLFETSKKHAPCIIFIDEIDAVGRRRGTGLGGGHDEREQTLNQLLVEMDGFDSTDGVILVAASNRPDVLDPALLRPGRFDRQVVVNLPDLKGRKEILQVHTRKVPLADDADLTVIARGTSGFSGAALANLVNEAALIAAHFKRDQVTLSDLEEAKDKVLMGKERRSLIMTEGEKRIIAYHEAGHTVVAFFTPDSDPLHKVTIVPRGMALGLTQTLPTEDKYSYTKTQLEARIAVLMGGRVGEKMGLSIQTTGAANDFEMATELAVKMIKEFGMSRLGPRTFGERTEQPFLGLSITRNENISQETARKIDEEVDRLIKEGKTQAEDLLKKHFDNFVSLAEKLLEKETLELAEIESLLGSRPAAN